MKNKSLIFQSKFTPIRHKNYVIVGIGISVLVTLVATIAELPWWAATGGIFIYLALLVYSIYESIRNRSYMIIISFAGMMAIGVYYLLILFGIVC